jgi:hypothetical protein
MRQYTPLNCESLTSHSVYHYHSVNSKYVIDVNNANVFFQNIIAIHNFLSLTDTMTLCYTIQHSNTNTMKQYWGLEKTMADAKEILELGIEAARDGNREEACNLFALLTETRPPKHPGMVVASRCFRQCKSAPQCPRARLGIRPTKRNGHPRVTRIELPAYGVVIPNATVHLFRQRVNVRVPCLVDQHPHPPNLLV